MFTKIYDWLIYLTNNEKISPAEWRRDEVFFDVVFFVVLILDAIFIGIPSIIFDSGRLEKAFWVVALVIWIWENIRHNRE